MSTNAQRGYVSVNGLRMYYEIHGEGPPLVLLHGGLMTIETSFAEFLPSLARTRRVIAVEQQAHGRTADIDRPLTFEQEANDTAALLGQLEILNTDVFGYSDGGIVGLGLAIRQPKLVRKLVLAGANYNNDGLHPEMLQFITAMADQDPASAAATLPPEMRDAYVRVAPRPEDWPILVSKEMKQSATFKGWRPDDLKAIKAPVLIVVGDADIVRLEHAVEMLHLFGGGVAGDMVGLPDSQLAVLPGTTHELLMQRADLLLPIILAFLDAPAPKTS